MGKLSNVDEEKKFVAEGRLVEHAAAEAEAPERETHSLGRRVWNCLIYISSRLLKRGRRCDPMVNVEAQGL